MMEEPAQSAAEAFEALKQEVALLRMAVQQLLNERQTPDYSQTLGKIMRDMKEAADGMTWLVNRPAIQVPADELASRICAAGKQARKLDRETVLEAARAMSQATGKIDGLVSRAKDANSQRQWLWRVGIGGVSGGTLAGMLLAIGLLHVAPEHSAAWILGLNGCRSANHRIAIK
ncbi:MAG: hypothetical protein QM647_13745 [Asticcacaulis sp.]|uniref:hypothetical protein n=1 Tax=Asticcacaulis sp. TaxID=1872648 RepID=UPI0039E41394